MAPHGAPPDSPFAELAAALGVAQATVRCYLDLLDHLFLIRQLRPWHENLRKRQVKRPKVYVRDSGLYHHLIGVATIPRGGVPPACAVRRTLAVRVSARPPRSGTMRADRGPTRDPREVRPT